MSGPIPISKELSTALVTGASGGIGQCIAHRLADRGYRVIVTGRNREVLSELTARLGGEGRCVAHPIDLADGQAIAPAITALRDAHGPIDVLINNAGGGLYRAFLDQSREEHQRLMQVNYFAPAEFIRLLLPTMLERGRGRVINIASISARIGPWGHAGYATAKAALISLTQTLAAEHHNTGVHFSYVNPGIVDTAYFERSHAQALFQAMRRRAIPPDRVARAVMGLLDRPRPGVYVPRHHRLIDWLHVLHPRFAHGLVRRQSQPAEFDNGS